MKYLFFMFLVFLCGCNSLTSEQECVNEMLWKIRAQNEYIVLHTKGEQFVDITPELIEAL